MDYNTVHSILFPQRNTQWHGRNYKQLKKKYKRAVAMEIIRREQNIPPLQYFMKDIAITSQDSPINSWLIVTLSIISLISGFRHLISLFSEYYRILSVVFQGPSITGRARDKEPAVFGMLYVGSQVLFTHICAGKAVASRKRILVAFYSHSAAYHLHRMNFYDMNTAN